MAGISIFSIVTNKHRYGKKLYLIILLKIDKILEVGFYYTILLFSLADDLQIKGDRKFFFNAEEIA